MNLQDIIKNLQLVILTDPALIAEKTAEEGYASDMLSCVMSGAKHNSMWVTLQSHLNIIAVASLLDLAAIIVTEGNIPEPSVIHKANQEGIVLLSTEKPTFQVAGRLWELGIRA